jgi:uncharacterized protein (DUF2147 family)
VVIAVQSRECGRYSEHEKAIAMTHLGLRRLLIGAAAGVGLCGVSAARELTMPLSPLGEWLTANGDGVIAINWCGAALCGRIVGIKRSSGEPIPRDASGHSQCGLTIITGGIADQDGTWRGRVIDPRDGRQYQAELWVDERDRLHMRGFLVIPLLGRTEIWHRFSGRLTPDCGMT